MAITTTQNHALMTVQQCDFSMNPAIVIFQSLRLIGRNDIAKHTVTIRSTKFLIKR